MATSFEAPKNPTYPPSEPSVLFEAKLHSPPPPVLFMKELSEDKVNRYTELEKIVSAGIKDREEAQEIVDDLRKIVDPVISVPKKYYREISTTGRIDARYGWIEGLKLIVGTLGRDPFLTPQESSEDRLYFKVKDHISVKPRFTGKDTSFHGVVYINTDTLFLDQDVELIQ